jgi:predicted negative regulator of RcsB-dependent stress response
MKQPIEILLNQGVLGAVFVIALVIIFRWAKYTAKMHEDRLKDKDEIIKKLSENELKIAQIIANFQDQKPVMEEIRELLRKIYTKSIGL